MEISGKKNLELTKRALLSHLVYCSHHALRSPEKTAAEKWDPEIAETNKLLDAVEININRMEDHESPSAINRGIRRVLSRLSGLLL